MQREETLSIGNALIEGSVEGRGGCSRIEGQEYGIGENSSFR
jgi:hypothetical protein